MNMGLRVLIVDDAGFIRHLLSKILNELGCSVIGEARTGTEGLQMIKSLKPDLVFMDLVLPEKNGVEVTLEAKEFKPQLPIVAMSTTEDESIKRQALQAGCFDFLEKPFNQDSVGDVLEKAKSLEMGVRYG